MGHISFCSMLMMTLRYWEKTDAMQKNTEAVLDASWRFKLSQEQWIFKGDKSPYIARLPSEGK
jgi:hypothetical protein